MAPVTSEIGFLEADADVAAERFASWRSSLSRFRREKYEQRRVEGELAALLCAHAPLTSVMPHRFLFVPTRSSWTAYFDNGHTPGPMLLRLSPSSRRSWGASRR
jgi:hypothetical protein